VRRQRCSKNLLILTRREPVKKRRGLGPTLGETGRPSVGGRLGTSHESSDPFQFDLCLKVIPSKRKRKFSQRGVVGCGALPAVAGIGQVKVVICFKMMAAA
jgi:hypothetical protein